MQDKLDTSLYLDPGRFTPFVVHPRMVHPFIILFSPLRIFHLPDDAPLRWFHPRMFHPPKCSPPRNISNFQGALKLCTKQN